jgi:flagellar motor switch protein FliM
MDAPTGVLARKLTGCGVARSPLPETEAIGETFARFIEDELRPLVKTAVSAMLLETRILKLAEALDDISVPSMLALIDVADADTSGLLCVDADLAYHLTDLTLGGDPAIAPLPTVRTFTSIDTTISRLHQDALLAAFVKALSAIINKPIIDQLRIGSQHQNISQVRFAPGYVDTLAYTVALDIGDAARMGNCILLIPLAALDAVRAAAARGTLADGKERPDDLWRIAMRQAAATAPVRLDAVLHRKMFTLAELNKLKLGDVIPLPRSSVDAVELVLGQPNQKSTDIARGRLGGLQSKKVVKLSADVDPRVRTHIEQAL